MDQLELLDLFSGQGGFSLGLENTNKFKTVAFCEIAEFPRQILKRHWPDIRIYNDVKKITAARLFADGITKIRAVAGGFPCQDISLAGSQAGLGEETRSGLWSECKRIVGEIRPDYAVFENVTNLLSGPSEHQGAWFSRILCDLAEVGYDAEWHCIPASYVGAWHRRDRVWILAYPKKIGMEGGRKGPILRQSHLSQKLTRSFEKWQGRSALRPSRFSRSSNGVQNRVERTKCAGNAIVPQIAEIIGHAIYEDYLNQNSGNLAQ